MNVDAAPIAEKPQKKKKANQSSLQAAAETLTIHINDPKYPWSSDAFHKFEYLLEQNPGKKTNKEFLVDLYHEQCAKIKAQKDAEARRAEDEAFIESQQKKLDDFVTQVYNHLDQKGDDP